MKCFNALDVKAQFFVVQHNGLWTVRMATIKLSRAYILAWILVCGVVLTSTRPSSTVEAPESGRFIRSCGPHLGLLMLGACNKNHKRSPVIMNIIFAHYSGSQKMQQGNVIIHEAIRSKFLDPIHSPWVLEHEMSGESLQRDKDNNAAIGIMTVYRELARRAPGYGDQVVEKCCSSVCTEADFVHLCY
ncbi:hypothetical protein Ocin01_08246 [Orchesella cincta]|uniref:Insulin-like domain-containing protein n=1 Tax=Orchesella cincta TaxID=48709 RepID=A0A1D2MZQ6_ORCCI|nr:hypothetical protein Ocin01_08246 [Orchesella cincta]